MSDSPLIPVAEPLATPTRRRGLLVGAGLVAAVAGATLAFRQGRQHDVPSGEPAPQGFWEQGWDTPQGDARVALQAFRGRPLLVNFWATWCAPCVEELPLLNDFFAKNSANGWQVLGLAIDRPAAVQAFSKRLPLRYPVGMASASGSALMEQLGNPAGGLPFSVLLGAEGTVLRRKLGRLTSEDLETWARLK